MPLRRWLILVWLCFFIRGLFYCTVWPLWEGFDEWAHFGVAQNMSTGQLIIDRNAMASDTVNISLQLAAVPRGMTSISSGSVTREQYWDLPVEERMRRDNALRILDSKKTDGYSPGLTPAYEASQPPLYYWLIAIPLRLLRSSTLVSQVWFARVLTVAMASISIFLGFLLSRKVFENESLAFGMTALIGLMPGLAIDLARVSNEGLGLAVGTGLLLAVCRWIEKPQLYARTIIVGISLGLGLLTKAYFLTALPALLVLFVGLIWQHRKDSGRAREYATHAAVAFAIALGMGGWWYLRNIAQTGTLSGLDEALMLRGIGFAEKLDAAVRVDWYAAIDTVLLSHIWYSGWSLFALRRSIYRMFYYFFFVATCGFVGSRQFLRSSSVLCILVLYGFFWLGQGYQIVMLFISKSTSVAMGGWYLHSMIWAEVILFMVGIFAVVPTRFRKYLLMTFIVAMAGLDIYSLHFVSLPYYAHTQRLVSSDVFHLVIDKPQFLGSSGLIFLWVLLFLSTGLTVFAGFNVLRRTDCL